MGAGTAPWILAIDYGTSSSAAAIAVGSTVTLVEVDGTPRVPSVVLADDDGELIAGVIAVRQGAGRPDRIERSPKRRIGDRTVVLGDRRFRPVELAAAVLRPLAAEAVRRQGGTPPRELRITHPATWAGTRLAALRDAAESLELAPVRLVPEPVAAALHYADQQLAEGDLVAVYDLGGGTFDTAVLRSTAEGFEVVGTPGGSDRLGGEDFDERLYQHVGAALGAQDPEAWEQLRFADDRAYVRANEAFRTDVRAAKEALSSAADYTVYVPAPVDREIRVTRDELEHLIRPDLDRTVDELVATVERVGASVDDLAAVYLVGGSSRIPLVTRLLADRLGSVPSTWGDPKSVVALGAAGASEAAMDAVAPVTGPMAASPAPVSMPVGESAAAAVVGIGSAAPATDDRRDDTTPAMVAAMPVEAAPRGSAATETPGPPPIDLDEVAPAGAGGFGRSRRAVAVLVAAAVVLLGGGYAVARTAGSGSSGGSSTDEVIAGGSTTVVGSSTTGEPDGGAADGIDAVLAFDSEGDDAIVGRRRFLYGGRGRQLVNRVTLRNETDAAIERVWFEVVPSELAPEATDITFGDPAPKILEGTTGIDHAVVWYELRLAPGEEQVLSWRVPTGSDIDPGERHLAAMAELHRAAVAEVDGQLGSVFAALSKVTTTPVVDPGIPQPVDPDPGDPGPGDPIPGPGTDTTRAPAIVTTTVAPRPNPQPRPNRAPQIAAIADRTTGEQAAVTIGVAASDPDGQQVSVSVSGLPSGLTYSGGSIRGTVRHDAVEWLTSNRNAIRSRNFPVTVTARDPRGATAQRSFTLTVRDTHLIMPNYFDNDGQYSARVPDPAALAPPNFPCTVSSTPPAGITKTGGSVIYQQSEPAGSVVAWGQSMSFRYWHPTSC